jgi:type I restriction enzyme S subunit
MFYKPENLDTMKINNETHPQGYKMTELRVLPEEWKVVPLDNKYIEFQNGLWKGKKEPYIKVRVLRNTNFNNDGTIDFEDVAELDVEQRKFKNREIIKDDIILERSGGGPTQPVGRVVFFEREDQFMYSFSNFTSRIRINDKLIIFPKFLFYFLLDFYNQGKTNDIQNRTTGIRNLDFSKYKQVLIPLPPLDEQQKIAAVLSAVQEAKEKTQEVIDATKALKQSMMKHLFTYGPVSLKEAENVPLKETEIGPMPEDWEVVKLGEIFSIFAGGDVSKINYSPIKIDKYIYPIYSNSKENNGLYGFSDTYNAQENSITITARGNLGYAIPRYEKFNAIIRLLVLTPKNTLNIKFISEYINSEIIINLEGSSIPQLTVPKISMYMVPLPPLPVQQKIASILSAIDEKIEAEENKKKALEELFKSLLHNLMTAKIRINQLELSS